MDEMHPQSELENYKLQVDLLQEKLQRSEENRNQLEHKLEQILQKRSEHDKSVRSKARQKYQQFLDEQQKRNERNKLLVQMLERIDEQTSVMSARSERLKMMKYEMYFAKLVQAQTMRCIQNNAMAATTIPVLLQTPTATTAATAANSTPLTDAEQRTATLTPAPAATTYQIDTNPLPATYSPGSLYQLSGIGSNLNETLQTPRHWTLALATPAPTNMYTMTPTPAAAAAAVASRAPTLKDLDYLKYPIGYLPTSVQFAYQQQQQLLDGADMLSTNRYNNNNNHKIDNNRRRDATLAEIVDINDSIISKQTPQQTRTTAATKAYEKISSNDDNNNIDNNHHATELFEAMKSCENTLSHRAAAAVPATMLSTNTTTTTCTVTPTTTATSLPMMTATSTALTFDKLSTQDRKSKTYLQSTDDSNEAERAAAVTAKETAGVTAGARLPKATAFLSYNKSAAALPNPRDFVNANSSNVPSDYNNIYNNANGSKYYDADEKLAAVNRAADDADDANLMRRHKIDEAWSTTTPAPTITPTTTTTTTIIGKDNDNASNALLAGDKRFAFKNNRNSFDTDLTPPPTNTSDSYKPPQFARKEKMSIENIENTFYGELVKPVAADVVLATTESKKQAALTATNDLLEELASDGAEPTKDPNLTEQHSTAQDEPQQADYDYGSEQVVEPLTSYAPHNQSNFVESAAANYAPDAGVAVMPTESYASEAEAQQYQQYDATQAAGQDYDPNLDYQNYDAAAYQAAYGPNAYPGYTYDETTGQYTANDETQQYAEQAAAYDESVYMQQNYNEAALQNEADSQQQDLASNYDEYSQYQQQQQQAELTALAAAPTTAEIYNVAATAETAASLPQATTTKVNQPNTEPPPTAPTPAAAAAATTPILTPAPAPIKPILSTEKSAANDAQQKRKKRVNFVDSSETDESSSVKPDGVAGAAGAASADGGDGAAGAASSESDFDFSSSGGATNN